MATKLPKLKRNATGPTKPKAPGKANPTTPAQRQYAWGSKNQNAPTATRQPKRKSVM